MATYFSILDPPPGDLPYAGIKAVSPASPALQVDSSSLYHLGSPLYIYLFFFRFVSHVSHYRTLSIIPCVVE